MKKQYNLPVCSVIVLLEDVLTTSYGYQDSGLGEVREWIEEDA